MQRQAKMQSSLEQVKLTTPVAFIIFNRPEVTARVFEEIRRAQPPRLFVIADGPRSGRPGEAARCEQTRAVVMDHIDWPCEVTTHFSQENLGCGRRMHTGISWVFEQVQEAIIMEDDCLPDPSFFAFCQTLLDYHRHDDRVMYISGTSHHERWVDNDDSYCFTGYTSIWGWATWRRAWQHFDPQMTTWPVCRDRGLLASVFGTREEYRYWTRELNDYHAQKINAWAAKWYYAVWSQGGLGISPSHNLITNIGFGEDATHTIHLTPMANKAIRPMRVIKHPPAVLLTNRKLEAKLFRHVYTPNRIPRNFIVHVVYQAARMLGVWKMRDWLFGKNKTSH